MGEVLLSPRVAREEARNGWIGSVGRGTLFTSAFAALAPAARSGTGTSAMRVAYFTAGTVGAGHLVRGVAIGRALGRRGFTGDYAMFGPPLPFPVAGRTAYRATPVVEEEVRDRTRAPETEVARALAAFAPDLLLVDMFWGPLRHILPLAGCECWLLVRTCPRTWFRGPRDTPFEPSQFRRMVAIEPFRHALLRERIDPVVVCNPDECRPPDALRERLGHAREVPLVVVTHAGLRGELEKIEEAAAGEPLARFDLFGPDAPFPIAEWLSGADRVHSGAGYNSFWEARWLGYAARTRFTPFARKIDDQTWRLATCRGYAMQENGADALASWILPGG
jgi:hypothetical protein